MTKTVKTFHTHRLTFGFDDKVIRKSTTKAKIYRGVTLLTPGVFSDSMTQSPVTYSEDVLRKYADNWTDNYLNLNHSYEVLDRIGYIDNPRWEDGAVKADLYIYPVTENARNTIELIEKGLINWLSVEIKTEDRFDSSTRERYVHTIEFIGAAVVTLPACPDAKIKSDGPDVKSTHYE